MTEVEKIPVDARPVSLPDATASGEATRLAFQLCGKPRACPTSWTTSSWKASWAKRSASGVPGFRIPRAWRTSRANAI
jgi:hypothetical protein